MSKSEFFTFYFMIAFITSIYTWLFGEHHYQHYSKNLGYSLVWPVLMFKSYPEIDGQSQFTFANSYDNVVRSGPYDGRVYFIESIGLLSFYYYAQENPSINKSDFNALINNGKISNDFYSSIVEKGKVREKLAEHLDGMTMGDVIAEREDAIDDIKDLLAER